MKTALLDTNVLIRLEDTGRLMSHRDASVLSRAQGAFQFYIHPKQFEDIQQDKDQRRRDLLLARVQRYTVLERPPDFNRSLFEKQGWACKNRNDLVDNCLLACVLRSVVSFLITEDCDMKRKAQLSGFGDQVLSFDELEDLITAKEAPELACVRDYPCHTLDLGDTFFDSLRESYPTFNSWLKQCSEEQRRCWAIYGARNELRALCIYKIEADGVIDNEGFHPGARMLKLCTFKAAASVRGEKVGERLFHMAFQYAQKQKLDFIYFTAKEVKQQTLVDLSSEFGFRKYGMYDGDRVFGKYLAPQAEEDKALAKADYNRRFYPSYKTGADVNAYLVPIEPSFHEKVFPDISEFRNSLFGDFPEMYTSESNTIRKAYLSKSHITQIESGDLLLFYRSKDRQSVQALGAVVEVCRSIDISEIVSRVKRRTVYDEKEIRAIAESASRGVLVISFDLIGYFNNAVSLTILKSLGVAAPQSIRSLNDKQFEGILKAGK